jgi:hypothetical protein
MGWAEGLGIVFTAIAKAATAPQEDRARIIAEVITAHKGAVEALAEFWLSTAGELARGQAAIDEAKAKIETPAPAEDEEKKALRIELARVHAELNTLRARFDVSDEEKP